MYEKESEPKLVIQDNEIIDAIPFDIEKYKDYKKMDIDSFNQAIDSYYGLEIQEEKKKEDKKDYLVKQHKQAIEKLEEKESKKRDVIEIINNNYDLIEDILNTIKKAKEQYTWSQIKEMVESEDTPEANAIEQIKEHEGLIVVNLSGKNFELNITKTPTENINDLYENAKHLKSKKEKTEENLEKIDTIVEKIEKSEPLVPKIKEKRKRKRWYENFRHFWTSDEYLVVAGKDADTNEQLVKKHTEPTDVVLHAEIQGAPFVIVKSRTDAREKEVKEISPVAIREASQFGAVYSKAWQKDLGNIDVYWVRPDQVKKVPGLPKGSFQIQGERSYLKKTSLKLSFGFDLETRELLVAPPQTISNKCRYYQTIQPGEIPAKELAEQIKETIIEKAINQEDKEKLEMIDENEITKKIPSGKGRLL
jgi:predicted ribosome quality control (RQC) complex YloA/Tae2 family protein